MVFSPTPSPSNAPSSPTPGPSAAPTLAPTSSPSPSPSLTPTRSPTQRCAAMGMCDANVPRSYSLSDCHWRFANQVFLRMRVYAHSAVSLMCSPSMSPTIFPTRGPADEPTNLPSQRCTWCPFQSTHRAKHPKRFLCCSPTASPSLETTRTSAPSVPLSRAPSASGSKSRTQVAPSLQHTYMITMTVCVYGVWRRSG